MTTRAVVFDLWDTIARWDPASGVEAAHRIADRLGRDREAFLPVWQSGLPQRDTRPLAAYFRSFDAAEAVVEELIGIRVEIARRHLVPVGGALETLDELQRLGVARGLISVCTEDVPLVWRETPFSGRFESTVFSCSVGLRKPDPGIYALALDELGVAPEEALFVGDGANDELAGAERVGMRAVLIHRPGGEPSWPEARTWEGPRITSIPDVLLHL